MKNCQTCRRAVFDPVFGEYKCSVKKIIIYNLAEKEGCPDYKEGTPMESKKLREA